MKHTESILVSFAVLLIINTECLPVPLLSYEIQSKLLATHRNCLEKSSVDESIITAVRKGVFSDDEKFKNYILCSSKENGIRDENGVLNKSLLREKTRKIIGDAVVASEVFDKCVKEKKSPLEDAFNNFRCFYANSPKHAALYNDIIDLIGKRNQMSTYHTECVSKSSVERKILKGARKKGEFLEDPKFKTYLFCLAQKMGFMDSNGEFQRKEVIKQIVKENVDDSELADIITKNCFDNKDNPEETAFFLYKCYYDSTPIHIDVLPDINSDNKGKKGDKFNTECLTESGVEEQLVEKERKGEFIEDPKLKNYMYCMTKKIGFQNKTGYIQKQILKDKLSSIIKDEVIAQKLIDLCALDRSLPQDTAYYTVKCYQENSPSHLNILKPPRNFGEEKGRVKSYIKDCSVQTGVSKRAVLLARKGEFSNEPQLKYYLYCISRKAGIQNERGEINKDAVRSKLTARFSAAEAEKLIELCVIEKDTPQNTAFEAFRCYYKEARLQMCTIY